MVGAVSAIFWKTIESLCRMNHSCRPNTEFHWSEEHGVEEVRAARGIEEGEELTDCYLDLRSSTALYFYCTCTVLVMHI